MNYYGMCVGGPKDGEFFTASTPLFEVAVYPPHRPHTFDKVVYVYVDHPSYTIGFWVTGEKISWSIHQILLHIMQNYKAPEHVAD